MQTMDGSLQAAVRRGLARRMRLTRGPIPATVVGVLVYAGLVAIVTLHLVLTWLFPAEAGQVAPGILALSTSLTVANALWAVLLILDGLACFRLGARRGARSVLAFVVGLVLVGLVQALAMALGRVAQM